MKATEANLLNFLRSPKQLMIPIYQRTYSWTRKECHQLWEDVKRAAQDQSVEAHFVGSIVYIARGIYQATGIPQLLVIDGQQRLTTLSLLISALAHALETSDEQYETSSKRLINYYLKNRDEMEDLRYKLVLTRSDKQALCNVIDSVEITEKSTHRIYDNYRYFEKLIREENIDLDLLYEGIGKLLIVDVSLDRRYDNPQLIFESLNSTGLDLTQADLIRNFILMGLEPEVQDELYRRYWYPLEQSFGQSEYAILFDRFMRDYLTIKSPIGAIPVIKQVYNEFKDFVRLLTNQDVAHIVADIYHYAQFFVKLVFPNQFVEDEEIRFTLTNINTLKVDVAYPFLIETYDDFETRGLINRDEFLEILQMVEAYVFRRAICGIPTNSLNKTFATLKRSIDRDHYLESVKAAFLLMSSYRRFPREEEFWDEFTRKDIYNLRTRRNYLLSKLENYNRKEWVNIEAYTIEHILPQNPKLSPEWRNMLGEKWQEVQARYLHTIGNLTLTGYNPELSDKTFEEKRDIEGGFADSPIRLNRSLAHLNKWTEKEINDRSQMLADLALEVWRLPSLPENTLAYYSSEQEDPDLDKYTLNQYEYLEGEVLTLFQALRTRILNLDASVREEYKAKYIAYKTTTNFVDIQPQKKRLRLWINLRFEDVSDPKDICRNVKNIGHYGNGDVEFALTSNEEIEYVMSLITQSFEFHSEDLLL